MKLIDLFLCFEFIVCFRENKEILEMIVFYNLNYVWNYSEKFSVVSFIFGII